MLESTQFQNSGLMRLLTTSLDKLSRSKLLVLRDDIRLPLTPAKNVDVIVSRSQCLYVCEDLTKIPQKYRQKHVATRLTEISPFTQTGSYVSWFGNKAGIWFWDAQSIQRRVAEFEYTIVNYFPEALFYDRAEQTQFLATCIEGVEEQQWDEHGVLIKSIWQPADSVLVEHKVQQRSMNSRPFQTSLSDFNRASNISLVYWAFGLGFALWTAVLLGQLGGVAWQQVSVAQQIADLEQASEQTLTARSAAVNAVSELKTITDFLAARDSYAFFSQIADTLEELDATIVRWNTEGKRVVLVISSEVINPVTLVEKLQELNSVDSVQISKSGQNQQTELVISRSE